MFLISNSALVQRVEAKLRMNLEEVQNDIINEYQSISNWEDRYKRIISKGKALPSLSEKEKLDDLLVKGCQSKVWLIAELTDEGRIQFRADSDALIVKGLISLLLDVYSGRTPDEIIESSPRFIEEIGLNANLSQTRSNGLAAMVKQMKFYALAFKAKLGS